MQDSGLRGHSIPPKWPYCSWKTGDYRCDQESRNQANNKTDHVFVSNCEDTSASGLSLLFRQFKEELRLFDDPVDQEINKEINEMMSTVAEKLKRTNVLFESCRLIKAGSVAEGTKISQMNEFDFLLVVDLFRDVVTFSIVIRNHFVAIYVVDTEESRERLMKYPSLLPNFEIHYESRKRAESEQDNTVEQSDQTPALNKLAVTDLEPSTDDQQQEAMNDKEGFTCPNQPENHPEPNTDTDMQAISNQKNLQVKDIRPSLTKVTRLQHKGEPNKDIAEDKDETLVGDEYGTNMLSKANQQKQHSAQEGAESTSNPQKEDSETQSQILFLNNVRQCFLEPLLKCLKQTIPEGWELVDVRDKLFAEPGSVCTSDIAVTLHLYCSKHDRDVDIDICLCMPLSFEQITRARLFEDKQTKAQSTHFFCYVENLMEAYNEMEVFAIMGENSQQGMMFGVPAVSTRVTAPELERSIFLHYGPDDGRVKTYRYAKCVASIFLPKVSSYAGCKRCCHCVVKSYHLKNIILFLIKNHQDDAFWTDDNILNRTVEVFDILLRCIPDKEIRDKEGLVGKISTFMTPGLLRLDCISTYNPSSRICGKKTQFLFTQDSDKPMRELSVLPVYKESLQTGHHDVDHEIRGYFQYLHNEHWDSYELVNKISNMLHKLKDINVCSGTV